ncbi:MAG: N-acetyl sugar amidotransferase [Bacteroidetes bacterium]|nr:N-acetyl sugar amidotransferase [Bacteroidota bacterium]
MQYCKRCLMPNTRPGSIFDEEAICQACHNYDTRAKVDWKARHKELEKLCDEYRRDDGYYDCVIPVSGGKDSHYQVYTMKIKMGMNPLLITIGDPFTATQAGMDNFKNLGETFGCDHIAFYINPDLFRRVTRIGFEESLNPLMFIETVINTLPVKMALQFKIPLIIYGEDGEFEYGSTTQWTNDALAWTMRLFENNTINVNYWLDRGISLKDLNPIIAPSKEDFDSFQLRSIFMSYYEPWSSVSHLEIAKRYGFRDLAHEWKREGCIEDFEQIDSIAYLVHLWLKYPKFGFQRASDIASRRIREGLLSKQEAKSLIKNYDQNLDRRAMDDFNNFLGYTPKQFWKFVDKFWNQELFENKDGAWVLKNPVYK